jgi:hypothetical protein
MFVFGFKSYAAVLAAAAAVAAVGLAGPPARALGYADGTDTPDARTSAAPAPAPDKSAALASSLALALQQGTLDRSLLTATLNAELGDDALTFYRSALSDFGKPLHLRLRSRNREETGTSYVYRIYYTGATADLSFALDDGTGKISALYLRGGPPVAP